MKRKKPKHLATCDGRSTTHLDYDKVWHYIVGKGVHKQAGSHSVPYFEVPLPFEKMADVVFDGHPNAYGRLRAVVTHMIEARTPEGEFCSDMIPMKGRSQGRERMFCERKDQADLLLAFSEQDRARHFDGVSQGRRRRMTEATHDLEQYQVMQATAFNIGDFEGYRLCGNAVEEILRDGDVSPNTARALEEHYA